MDEVDSSRSGCVLLVYAEDDARWAVERADGISRIDAVTVSWPSCWSSATSSTRHTTWWRGSLTASGWVEVCRFLVRGRLRVVPGAAQGALLDCWSAGSGAPASGSSQLPPFSGVPRRRSFTRRSGRRGRRGCSRASSWGSRARPVFLGRWACHRARSDWSSAARPASRCLAKLLGTLEGSRAPLVSMDAELGLALGVRKGAG